MTTSLIAAPDAAPASLPLALTDQDADRIAAAISAARTESTRRVYAYTWGQWARWCAARDLSPLPGDPAALCAYLTERAAAGIAISSLDGACTAIRHVHRMHAAADPVASEIVRQVCLGLRRTYGTAPRRLARPLSTAGIRQILDGIDRTDPVGVRDAAIILLGSRDRTGDPRWFLASTPERQVVHSGHAWFNHRLTSGKQHPAITAGPQGRIARFPWLLPWHGVPQAFRTADPLNQQAAA